MQKKATRIWVIYTKQCLSLPTITLHYSRFQMPFTLFRTPKNIIHTIKEALLHGKHVLCESPISLNNEEWKELNSIADEQGLILMDSIKTAYSMAYDRLCLLAKSGKIGKIYSIDATCTSLSHYNTENKEVLQFTWNSFCAWAPTALLPILQLLGTDYTRKTICTHLIDDAPNFDTFTKISFIYPHAVASLKVGQGIKSEGELVISGTEGYIYVPAPWWKTDYFEVRRENPATISATSINSMAKVFATNCLLLSSLFKVNATFLMLAKKCQKPSLTSLPTSINAKIRC